MRWGGNRAGGAVPAIAFACVAVLLVDIAVLATSGSEGGGRCEDIEELTDRERHWCSDQAGKSTPFRSSQRVLDPGPSTSTPKTLPCALLGLADASPTRDDRSTRSSSSPSRRSGCRQTRSGAGSAQPDGASPSGGSGGSSGTRSPSEGRRDR